ncbi:hypothetical protein [Enterococcus phage MDA2]|uniref:Uncharacterized protein n=1 Tax=Enterococcus phage MDA2 TaxID=2816459 RepID=A0AAE7RKM9_9CAUD|nr:hypothetical protein [Enterococcus phage MDA2]
MRIEPDFSGGRMEHTQGFGAYHSPTPMLRGSLLQ